MVCGFGGRPGGVDPTGVFVFERFDEIGRGERLIQTSRLPNGSYCFIRNRYSIFDASMRSLPFHLPVISLPFPSLVNTSTLPESNQRIVTVEGKVKVTWPLRGPDLFGGGSVPSVGGD